MPNSDALGAGRPAVAVNPLPDAAAARATVLRNAPLSDAYEPGSFVERLLEDAIFDAASCQALEAALLVLLQAPEIAAETDRFVFSIYRYVAMHLLCHLNPNDVCGVDNLGDDAVIDLKNRFDLVVGSYFCRQPFETADWWRQWNLRSDVAEAAPRPG